MKIRHLLLFLAALALIGQESCPPEPVDEEVCDGVDNDGDGLIDEDFDADNDGYLDESECRRAYPDEPLDCNDNNSAIHPGAFDVCGDGVDTDCDGEDAVCTFFIYGSYPSPQAAGVPLDIQLRFYFSEPYPGDPAKISMFLKEEGGAYASLENVLAPAKTFVSSYELSLTPDIGYCARLEIDQDLAVPAQWPLSFETCFTTERPCGTAVQLVSDIYFQQFGGDNALGQQPVRDMLNDALVTYGDDLPVAMMFDGIYASAAFPLSGFLTVIGEYTPGTPNVPSPDGWVTSLEGCTVSSSGAFNCTAPYMTLPMPLDSAASLLLFLNLHNADMTAIAISSGNFTDMDDFVMTAAMTYDNIVVLADELGAPELAGLVVLDQDLDGDGIFDAATVSFSADPKPLVLEGCDPA